ncbi:MAG: TonB-dependent receptor [Flavobacteriales bacterium]
MKKTYLIVLLIICSASMYAQLDSIQHLNEVLVIDAKLEDYSEGFKLIQLSDTLIARNSVSLTEVLNFNSTLYFKENGYGMVSSPSFRGTNASQTAVIWNGIPVNSNLNGQTDFNTISPSSFNTIIIRSGGGSTQYGSGAVGGSIHLNNTIDFQNKQSSELKLSYGSFSTIVGVFKSRFSSDKKYIDFGIDFISSENDYEYIDLNRKNENGNFDKLNIAVNAGLNFGKSTLSWNSNYFLGNRNFSGTITSPSKDSYKDLTTRNLVTWNKASNKWNNTIKGAHTFERYRYYPQPENNLYFEGQSTTYLGDYQLEYEINKDLKISSIINYTYIKSKGSNIGTNDRNTLATILLWKHQINEKLSYGINLRQEFLTNFENPFLASFDVNYAINKWYTLKANASKNYRVPTFNDLYWNSGGNENLNPETSYQAEIANEFIWNQFRLNITGFYISSTDLIKWQPNEDGLFTPLNISKTENLGIEVDGNYSKSIKEHQLNLVFNYAYTAAKDLGKNKQLVYVPYYKATGALTYDYKKLAAYYQLLFNGEVFTTTDNNGVLDRYSVSNLGLEYLIQEKSFPIKIGIKLNNIFNTYYENVAYRPMPNRNIQTFINFKF